jgi:hypothetical protein
MAKELLSDATIRATKPALKMFGCLMVMACIFSSSQTIQDGGGWIHTINAQR